MKTRSLLLSLAMFSSFSYFSRAAHEIGFIEKFALAEDREAVLKELIPGTEDYYFYTALQLQNTGKQKELAALITQWSKRNGGSGLLEEIRHRQALLNYETDSKATLDYLKRVLGVEFNHTQQTLNPKPDLPVALDPKSIALELFIQHALRDPNQLADTTDAGVELLVRNKTPLTAPQRRQLLARVKRPDLPGLLDLIVEDLKTPESRGFGEFPIHQKLLVAQLQTLKQARPELMTSGAFVQTWLGKLRPNADVDLERDAKAREAWLDQAYNFVKDLGPGFNTLKAVLLKQRLEHDEKLGQRNVERFLEYLKLPRDLGYVNPKYRSNQELFRHAVDLNADLKAVIGYPPVSNDVALVRSYLLAFLETAEDTKLFAPYIEESFLQGLFAEAKLTAGVGNAEKWFSLISPGQVQALRERVDLDFDAANPEIFAVDQEVSVDVFVKNVPSLTTSIFEINTLNYFRSNQAQIGTDLNLDGLIANVQSAATYEETPIRRVKRNFKFPQLNGKRGVWIVDFIGNGKSSRALIRKGQLHFVTRPSSVGTAITVLDEAMKPLPKATALVGTQQFTAGETGEIILPFSNQPGRQAVILTDGAGFAQLEQLTLQGENYELATGFHVPHESLLGGKRATVAIRPTLTVNGAPTDLALLEEVTLNVRSTTIDGVQSSLAAPTLKLSLDKEATFEFSVPERLSQISFTLEGKVKSLLTGEKITLQANHQVTVNTLDRTFATSDLYLSRISGNYILQQLGRTGEPRAEQPCVVKLFRDDFTWIPTLTLKTDLSGAINLGSLTDIARIQVNDQSIWKLPKAEFTVPANLHSAAGQTVSLPWMDGDQKPDAALVSLLEIRNGTFVRDVLNEQNVAVTAGYLTIKNLEPGDYSLRYGSTPKEVTIRVSQGKVASNFLIGDARILEVNSYSGLQIMGVAKDAETLTIGIGAAGEDCRVHVLASRFLPTFDAFAALGITPGLEPMMGTPSSLKTLYVSGRTLGEEYRYVLDRRGMKKFPGSLLPRPGLLLNPWAIRDTSTTIDEAAEGQDYARAADGRAANAPMAAKRMANRGMEEAKVAQGPRISSVDFLAKTGATLYNLVPDKNGNVSIKLADLGDRQFIRILAVDQDSAVQRDLSLPDAKTQVRDLTLRNGLDPKGHFTRQNEVTILEKDAPHLIKDAVTTEFEVSGDLGQIFRMFTTLNKNQTLEEFRFLLDWPTYPPARKTELYSKHACHELSFFLHRKDPAFFKEVILPYLANKRDKTFMDHYLLGADLKQYLPAWKYGRLNVVERILLAQRHPEQAASTARDIKDTVDLVPVDPGSWSGLFDTMLSGSALDANRYNLALSGKPGADANGRDEKQSSMDRLAAPASAAEPPPAPAGAIMANDGVLRLKSLQAEEMMKGELAAPVDKKRKADESRRERQVMEKEVELRKSLKEQFYRKQPPTQEWAENNYYKLRISAQVRALVDENRFWQDYAAWDGKGGFLSKHIAEAAGSFTEMALALAILDLPFPSQVKPLKSDVKDLSVTLTPTSRALLFHREIKPAEIDKEAPRLLVSQNFYRNGDRHVQEGSEKLDKFVSEEFLTGVVYGCQIVVTNPTSSNQNLDLLLQIPQGAIPVQGSKPTQNVPLRLESYRTHTQDYFFYFPKAGSYAHHPVHVSKSEKIVAFAEPFTFTVVNELTKQDTKSWDYVSQFSTPEEVISFLEKSNLRLLDLGKMAWRMHQKEFFQKAIALLSARHVYDNVLWSYSLMHNDPNPLRQFLLHSNLPTLCGPVLKSKLIDIDPIDHHLHEHLEYSPLVNARTHRLGGPQAILNGEFHEQYQSLLSVLIRQSTLSTEDHLAATYYLLLQDRIEEAQARFAKVDATKIAEKLQYDYLAAVLACYQSDTATARKLALAHANEPVDRWREKFAEVLAQLDEIDGKQPAGARDTDREQKLNQLAATEPSLEFTVESKEIRLKYRNVKEAVVNYYPMDLEFLFSTAPFVGSDTKRFGMIQPNKSEKVILAADKDGHTLVLPKEYHSANVLVEITAAGKSTAHAYYANELNVVVSESQGQVQVLHAGDNRPLAKTYVKVFAEIDGQPKFYKDGYTDLRGKFDYLSLSTTELDNATRFSILILNETHGAAVKEVKPPRQ